MASQLSKIGYMNYTKHVTALEDKRLFNVLTIFLVFAVAGTFLSLLLPDVIMEGMIPVGKFCDGTGIVFQPTVVTPVLDRSGFQTKSMNKNKLKEFRETYRNARKLFLTILRPED